MTPKKSICRATLKTSRIPKHQFNTTRLFRSVEMPAKAASSKRRIKRWCSISTVLTTIILDDSTTTDVFKQVPFTSGFTTLRESEFTKEENDEDLEVDGEGWEQETVEGGWGIHDHAIAGTAVTVGVLLILGLTVGLILLWRKFNFNGHGLDEGHDYGKGFEIEQEDTAEKLGMVAQGMEAMVEAMTDLEEEDSETQSLITHLYSAFSFDLMIRNYFSFYLFYFFLSVFFSF